MHYLEVHNLKEKCKFNSEDLILKMIIKVSFFLVFNKLFFKYLGHGVNIMKNILL